MFKNTSCKQWTYKNKMNTYCVKCRKGTKNINPKMLRTKNNKLCNQNLLKIKKQKVY